MAFASALWALADTPGGTLIQEGLLPLASWGGELYFLAKSKEKVSKQSGVGGGPRTVLGHCSGSGLGLPPSIASLLY